jgi:hypothetical protein
VDHNHQVLIAYHLWQHGQLDLPPNLLLLAEVIQMVPERERCWAKPLGLAHVEKYQLKLLHNLRETSQLILPASFFREALDTEVLPLMTEFFY